MNYAADNQIYIAEPPSFCQLLYQPENLPSGDSDDSGSVNSVLLFTILSLSIPLPRMFFILSVILVVLSENCDFPEEWRPGHGGVSVQSAQLD